MLPLQAKLKQVLRVPVKIAVNSFQLKCHKLKLNKASFAYIKRERRIAPSPIKLNRKSGEVSKFKETLNTMFIEMNARIPIQKTIHLASLSAPLCLSVSFKCSAGNSIEHLKSHSSRVWGKFKEVHSWGPMPIKFVVLCWLLTAAPRVLPCLLKHPSVV